MFRKRIKPVWRWIECHQTLLTASIGSTVVAVWTVLRHITNGMNFDVIGQIGVAEQWARGLHDGAVFGSTNYLLKMPLYALVNLLGWLPPTTRLLILALVCSVGAFLLIYLLLRKIVRMYGVQDLTLLNLGVLWLAIIAGRVFWVDYANSRNLEVAGGLTVLYLALLIQQRSADWRRWVGLVIAGSLVFFADPLQMYVIGGGIGLASLWVATRNNTHRRLALLTGSALFLAAVLSRVLAWVSTILLPVSYLTPPRTSVIFSIETLSAIGQNIATSTLRIFDINVFTKAFGVNSLRQLGSLLLLGLTVYVLARYRTSSPKRITAIFYWLIIWNYLVYIVSGNAGTAITERYLIMVPLFVVALLALHGDALHQRVRRSLVTLWIATVTMSGLLLFGGIVVEWPDRYKLDQPMFRLAAFAKTDRYDLIVSSQELAIPTNYYAGYDTTIVPTACQGNGQIATKNLFYDQAAYHEKIGRTSGVTAVVFPSGGIISGTLQCSEEDIRTQLGTPIIRQEVSGVGILYEYRSNSASLLSL